MNLFFELIQISLGVKNEFSSTPTSTDWQMLFAQAKRQALVGVLFLGIERLSQNQRPPQQILLQWFAFAERLQQMNRKLNQNALQLDSYFKSNNFGYTILKGQGIATLYPNPLLRTPGDIDVWARPKDNDKLTLNRIRSKFIGLARDLGKAEDITYTHVCLPLFKDTEVELHFTPSWISDFGGNFKLQHFFEVSRANQFSNFVELPEGIGSIPVPTIEFNRVFILLHIYRHLFGEGIGLRQMMDYYYVLCQSATKESKQRTLVLLKDFKLLKFASATMYVLQEVFGMEDKYLLLPPNKKEGSFLLNEIMLAGNFGKYDQRNKHINQQGDIKRFIHSIKRNLRFLQHYPSEVISDPFFRARYYVYRHWKGWK